MIGPVFVDTNVIVYRYDTRVPAKQSRANADRTRGRSLAILA